MTTEALSGEITKIGKSGRNYTFGFGWSFRYNLEQVYGDGLVNLTEEKDEGFAVANVLISALKAKSVNQMKETISKQEMYELLDDFDEATTRELVQAGKRALGFISRVLGVAEEDVKALAQKAVENQPQPTGTPS
ncbi:hypothetical protein IC229_26240 [Spirosoma sp. BT702]|uniref:Uncharacterized protein n=1 Tax=Spirosoma profusum TaxID=2771354 RepID=A0A927ASN6_9BACT|nr:hypothetical protein [Spirosoma profusum]MBD2704171.1 hypothetical protein [Spirosoma profusum]